jgi:broad specificity phosphatase PhoE
VTKSSEVAEAMRTIERAYLIGVEGTTEILLIRHGEAYKTVPGDEDPALSAVGRKQVERLAMRIRRLKMDAVYSSPLKRARETALAITDDVLVEQRLAEAETKLNPKSHLEVTEPSEAIIHRMKGAVDDAIDRHAGGRIAMIGHGFAIKHYLSYVMRLEFSHLRIYPYFTGISTVRAKGERRMVGSLADVAHLEQ